MKSAYQQNLFFNKYLKMIDSNEYIDCFDFQGAGKTIQTAWSPQAFGSASGFGGGDYWRLSG